MARNLRPCLDGQLAATGAGVTLWPDDATLADGFCLGGTGSGAQLANGWFDELATFNRPCSAGEVATSYALLAPAAELGPISAEEDAAWQVAAAKRRAEREAASGGQESMLMLLSVTNCPTGTNVFLTNVVCALTTNAGWTLTFDLMGGTNGVLYDIFTTTSLCCSNITNATWKWLERGPTCATYWYTNQPGTNAFYLVGTPQDTDGDGLTDAFEQLVSKTDPLVGVNRIQTENAITGTTNWMLFNPITSGPSHGWPTNDADTTPEIQGFASVTSANLGESVDLYVDVRRTNDTNFSIEVFRLGWYGGQGGRQMTWTDTNATARTNVTLPSHKQPIPQMNPTNGLVDCLSGWTTSGTDTNLIWHRSYTLTIPTNWVSGVYVAKLTTGTNVTPQTTGKQSYIIFVVREDARSSDLLYQASDTTWQAYNPWGGASFYPYPDHLKCDYLTVSGTADRQGGTVSFNRPYAAPSCETVPGSLAYGSGTGEFLTMINLDATPAWEYNMVRWLERQGYDLTYCSNIDTHRPWPSVKSIRGFLSVGHDEYWSPAMRTNVEAARDRGVNLAFFGANVCYWQIHFTQGDRVFQVDKNPASGTHDLWGGSVINNPEIGLVGVSFASPSTTNKVLNLKYPLSTASGTHWTFDQVAGLTNATNRLLPGLLGYEVDGCWTPNLGNCRDVFTYCPAASTLILADTLFETCVKFGSNYVGNSYMTIYTATNRAQVFATGTMQWNWGVDDFGYQRVYPYTSYVHPAAQQMSHNVLRKFAGRETAPVIFHTADAITSGNWTNLFGSQSNYWIAGATALTNLPSYAQISITNQHVQVWADPSSDSRALLKPGFSNRIESAWTTTNIQGSSFTIDVNFTDTNAHQVALYCVDWAGTGTVLQKIEIFESSDTSFSHPLDVRSFQLPGNGVYLVWQLAGHKIIRVAKPDADANTKALVSALFIGAGS